MATQDRSRDDLLHLLQTNKWQTLDRIKTSTLRASVTEDGSSLLHTLAEGGYVKGCRYLLKDCNFPPSLSNYKGFRPLHYAACHGHMEVVHLLLHCGALINAPITTDRTALHHAACCKQADAVVWLYLYGADTQTCDHTGEKALDLVWRLVEDSTVLMSTGSDSRSLSILFLENRDSTSIRCLELLRRDCKFTPSSDFSCRHIYLTIILVETREQLKIVIESGGNSVLDCAIDVGMKLAFEIVKKIKVVMRDLPCRVGMQSATPKPRPANVVAAITEILELAAKPLEATFSSLSLSQRECFAELVLFRATAFLEKDEIAQRRRHAAEQRLKALAAASSVSYPAEFKEQFFEMPAAQPTDWWLCHPQKDSHEEVFRAKYMVAGVVKEDLVKEMSRYIRSLTSMDMCILCCAQVLC